MNSYYPPWIGGAETYSRNLTRSLAELGHEVTIYCSARPLNPGRSFDDKVEIIRMRTPLSFYGTPLTLFPASLFGKQYDVIHANFPSPYLSAVASGASALRRIPSVLTWHNDLPPVTSAANFVVGFHNLLAPIYLNHYSAIIATTNVYAKKSMTLRQYSKKIKVIRNGVDTRRFNPSVRGDRVRDSHGLSGCKVVLFVGALTVWHSYKGVDTLIKAFRLVRDKSKDVRLLIVGGGELQPSYEKLARDLKLTDTVVFTDRVSDESLPEYYAASDTVVLPSKNSSEGFGLALLEGMSTGKPVIGTRVGGIVDVIEDGKNGLLVNPSDVEELAHAIISLLGSGDSGLKMGTAGRKFAELHNWIDVAKKVEGIYRDIQ